MQLIKGLLPDSNPCNQSKPTKQPVVQPRPSKPAQANMPHDIVGNKAGLVSRLWQTVMEGKDEAATNAVKQLMSWYEQADQQSADSARLDPVQYCQILTHYIHAPASDDDLQGILRAVCGGVKRSMADIHALTAPEPDRADAPPLQKGPDSIASNEPTPTAPYAITPPELEKAIPA
jgi:hypothetical protein